VSVGLTPKQAVVAAAAVAAGIPAVVVVVVVVSVVVEVEIDVSVVVETDIVVVMEMETETDVVVDVTVWRMVVVVGTQAGNIKLGREKRGWVELEVIENDLPAPPPTPPPALFPMGRRRGIHSGLKIGHTGLGNVIVGKVMGLRFSGKLA
jgi:hypothetical protein